MLLDVLRPGLAEVLGMQSLERTPAYQGPERRAACAPWHWLRLALDEIDYGLLIVTHPSHVVHINHIARAELESDHPLQVVGQDLRTRLPADDGPVRDALADAAQRDRRCMLTIGSAGSRVSIAVVPLPATDDNEKGVTLLMFSKRRVCEELSVDAFARCHGLTAAETQVLKALCAGTTPNDAARRQGVRLSTVRTQIGSIRAKTGATSIRALVQQVARLPPLISALRTPTMPADEALTALLNA
jgi:DNA-binding CsgD family transcriptional regulator